MPQAEHDHGDHAEQVVGYLFLRRAIGVLGMALPLWLWAVDAILTGSLRPRDSISAYDCSPAGDWFVGLLFAIGIFLLSYRGPEGEDALPANLACLFAILTATFSTCAGSDLARTLHFVSAAALFGVLIWFCLGIFTRHGPTMTPRKRVRNRVYRACGAIMIGCLVAIALHKLFLVDSPIDDGQPVFWLESIALWAFGFSWITKGEVLLGDVAGGPEAPSHAR